ncbi:helicase-related protein [Desulfonatronum thioautotrophicum]|uniref:helicase-related protein n=1 Tax=Desulfonatronum thioautotrophicum TaxID=617001 RepID=UPI0005EB1548|nr:helicase-related protein [Desulfonatronum thioautotrophicum]
MSNNRFCARQALAGLKDFQRTTVEYVFSRFHGPQPTSRFLVADEVGLGKTLVARGIIAKTIERLQDELDRIDVIYICSNASIATQNVNRLNIFQSSDKADTPGSPGFAIATRLTYLPKQISSLNNKVNFISLTPGTAFEHTRSRGGHAEERVILYRMLRDLPWERSDRRLRGPGLLNMLQATSGKQRWRDSATKADVHLDPTLSASFREALLADSELYARMRMSCERFIRFKEYSRISTDDQALRYGTIGKLRGLLAKVCICALRPSLVILDEFQRFKHLLEDEGDASLLARYLFEQREAKTLLLSATPYKPFTMDQETDQDDHYPDFLRTLGFLCNGSDRVERIKGLLARHRKRLQSGNGASAETGEVKTELEQELLRVMCRTERIAFTRDANAMLTESRPISMPQPKDLDHAALADRIASEVKAGDVIEYWKSAPYIINFLKHYELRRKLEQAFDKPSEELLRLFTDNGHLLSKATIEAYDPVDPGNPRMRELFAQTLDKDLWQLLWMPPSMPYSKPAGVYEGKEGLTKSLIFSSWSAVPDAIASVCTYEAQRRMTHHGSRQKMNYHDKVSQLLTFIFDAGEQRHKNMPHLAWLMPSPTLAQAIDPLAITLRLGRGVPVSLEELRKEITAICDEMLQSLPQGNPESRPDERWYWAAPVLLEKHDSFFSWLREAVDWHTGKMDDQDESKHLIKHIQHLEQFPQQAHTLGPRPADLAEVLCDLALAGPGTCALRALHRITPGDFAQKFLLSGAARIASGFRSLFNLPETIVMLRGEKPDEAYWRLTLRYAAEGNIQSMLDEHVHTLKESLGVQEHSPDKQIEAIAGAVQSALSLRTAQIQIDEIKAVKNKLVVEGFNTRSRFALRFGDIKGDAQQALDRASTVRDAFNSPFRPFILASTSIGQEGLDFHTWCHAVIHWNLPANPVDLEQREGRVHRYKGHAVRKNIAFCHGLKVLAKNGYQDDPWDALFAHAAGQKSAHLNDLVPYWLYDEGPARIERHIYMIPFSREIAKLKQLKKRLAFYRLAFGQPRQEDLIASIDIKEDDANAKILDAMISLAPRQSDIPRDAQNESIL